MRLRHATFFSLFLFVLTSCAPTTRYHSDLLTHRDEIKKIAYTSKIKVYEVDAGGVKTLKHDYTEKAKENFDTAIETVVQKKLKSSIIPLKQLDPDTEEKLRELGILYLYISNGIRFNTLKYKDLSKSIENFNYPNLDEFSDVSKELGTDYFLFLWGVDHVSTGGRIAMQIAAVLIGAAVGVQVNPQFGVSILSAALVQQSTGELLWHNSLKGEGIYDFRNYDNVQNMLESLFDSIPD